MMRCTDHEDEVLYKLSEKKHWTDHQKEMMKRHSLNDLGSFFPKCMFEDDTKGTIVYDNACNTVVFAQNHDERFFGKYALQCHNFHHKHGSTGKGHKNCGPGTNMIHTGLHNATVYHGNAMQQQSKFKKNSRVRSLEALISSECQPRMMNTFDYWHAKENKLQLV